jgi:hypothetical protein
MAGTWLANWMFGLHKWRSQRRREFLELWPTRQSDEGLWAEVALRHLAGSYLPSAVSKALLALPNSAMSLFEVSEVYEFLQLQSESKPQLDWKRWIYRGPKRRWVAFAAFNVGYFFSALFGAGFWVGATKGTADTSWAWGINAITLAIIAMSCLIYAGRLQTAMGLAPAHIARLNQYWSRQGAEPATRSVASPVVPTPDSAGPPLVG